MSICYFVGSIYPNWIERRLEMFKIIDGMVEWEWDKKFQDQDNVEEQKQTDLKEE